MKRSFVSYLLLAVVICLVGCRGAMYSAYETIGVYKRDLLKKYVLAARDEEKGAQEEFKDALTCLKEMTGFEGGTLEKKYRALQGDYDDAAARVTAVHERIADVEKVAKDMFKEWEKENAEIETESLKRTSRQQLEQTRVNYNQMVAKLKEAEKRMDPVLHKLKDYVLVLKHSLNAQAMDALGTESNRIQTDISKLLEDLAASIARADEFVNQMSK